MYGISITTISTKEGAELKRQLVIGCYAHAVVNMTM